MWIAKYYLKPMIKHWKTILRLFRSAAKDDWSEWSEITVDDLFDRVNSDEPPLLIDVRSPGEFDGGYGHIPNARSIPVLELKSHFEELDSFKEKEIVTMCPGGGMSLVAVEILEEAGFKDVKSLKGGTDLWHEKGHPTTMTITDEKE
jgi:rhodanese-related sulfurtransferase